jgi:hypothetical protein
VLAQGLLRPDAVAGGESTKGARYQAGGARPILRATGVTS